MKQPGATGPGEGDLFHLLVVDDDSRVRTLLTRFLSMHGFQVTAAASGEEARDCLKRTSFDLLVVDAMMRGETGIEFTQWLRRTSRVPVLLMTAHSDTPAPSGGLDTGADDYVAKPFEPGALLLKIANILKRRLQPAPLPPASIRFGAFTFHLDRGELKRDGELVPITDRERDVLRMFASRPDGSIRRDELLKFSGGGGQRAVEVLINRLRRKIEADPANPTFLQSTRDSYRLVFDESPPEGQVAARTA